MSLYGIGCSAAHPLRPGPRLLAIAVVDEVVHLLLVVVDLLLPHRRRHLLRPLPLLPLLPEEFLTQLLLRRLRAPRADLDPVLLLLRQAAELVPVVRVALR